jgi:hypothetical protein
MARRSLTIVAALTALLFAGGGVVTTQPAQAGGQGPYLTLLFSRTAVTGASNCAEDDVGVARLDTVVAPTLNGMGLHPTGTIETGPTTTSTYWCGHSRSTLYASWDLARQLASQYGWTFGSHSATYPASQAAWAATNSFNETCGSEQALTAQGLPGAQGLFAWPDNYVYQPALSDVEACFDFSRPNAKTYITDQNTATAPPFFAAMRPLNGGTCNDSSASCFTSTAPLATTTYTLPSKVIAMLGQMTSSQWSILQAYVLVTGSRTGMWDCTSTNPTEHWTDDTERYCWNDYLTIMNALPAGMTVADPATVAAAWGRTLSGSVASLGVTPSRAFVSAGFSTGFHVEGFASDGTDLGDVSQSSTFTTTGPASCTANVCGATTPGNYTVTVQDGSATAKATLTVVPGPVISGFAPLKGSVGTTVTVTGTGFGSTSALSIGGAPAAFAVISPTAVTATVPANAANGVIVISTPQGSWSSARSFSVVPTMSGFSPAAGLVGDTVTITGSGFDGVTGVAFNGTPAVFTIASPTQITTIVPAGASTGRLTVSSQAGTASVATWFLVVPSISGFTPTTGAPGTIVTITGASLTGATAVRFAGTNAASYTVNSDTSITAVVPAGARTGPIAVVTRGGTTKSSQSFVVSGLSKAGAPTSE